MLGAAAVLLADLHYLTVEHLIKWLVSANNNIMAIIKLIVLQFKVHSMHTITSVPVNPDVSTLL